MSRRSSSQLSSVLIAFAVAVLVSGVLVAASAAADPHVDTSLTPATPLPDPDLVVVRERFYGAEGVDLSDYGIDEGPHTFVQSLYFRLFADNNGGTIDSYSALVVLPESVTILGVITSGPDLGGSNDDGAYTASDALFGVGSDPDLYSENARGFETSGGLSREYIGIIDGHSLAFALHVGGGVDDFRLIIDYGDEFAPDLSFDLLGLDVVPPEEAVLLSGVQIGDVASPTVVGSGDFGETPSLLGIPLTAQTAPVPAPILPYSSQASLFMVRDPVGPTYVDTYDTELDAPFPAQFTLTPVIPNPRGLTDHENGLIYCSGRDGTMGVIDPVTRVVTTTPVDNLPGNVVDNTNLPGHDEIFLIRDTPSDSEVDVLDPSIPAYTASYPIQGVATPVAIADGSDGFLYILNNNGRLGWMSAAGDTSASIDLDSPGGTYAGMTSRPGSSLLYLLRNTQQETAIDRFDVITRNATFDFAALSVPLAPGDITDGPGNLLYIIGSGSGGPAGYTVVDPNSGAVLFSHEIMDFFGNYKAVTSMSPSQTDVNPDTRLPTARLRHQAWPNPFNPRTQISYELEQAGLTRLRILDARGRLVRELHRGWEQAGWVQHVWNGHDGAGRTLPSGTYFYQISTRSGSAMGKLTLIK